MNCRAGPTEPRAPGTGRRPVSKEIEMKAIHKPKSLPWLARRAGVPDQVADTLWRKALALADPVNLQAAEPRRQAEAMRYLLLMLDFGAEGSARAADRFPPACDARCQ